MPYASIADLPPEVRKRYSDRCAEVFRKVFNNAMSDSTGGGAASEESAFKIAHTAAGNCKAAGKSERSPLTMTDMTVKFAEGSDTIIEGYGVPFGLDLDGQQFTSKTERYHEWFPNGGRPLLVDHGFDPTIKFTSVGTELSTEEREEGDWVRGQLDKANKYYNRVKKLIEAGKVGWSSAAPDHKVKIAADGTIERWPVIEYSLTVTPAKPNRVAFAMKSALAAEILEGIEDSTDTVKQAAAELAADIEQTHEGGSEPESLADQSEQVLASLKAWAERMEDRSDFRAKFGRELSKANIESLREAHKLIGALLDRADAPSESEADAARKSLELALAITG